MRFLDSLIFSGGFMPHGNCYVQTRSLIVLHMVSDSVIAISYFFIPIILVHLIRKRPDVPSSRMALYWLLVNHAPPRQANPNPTERSS
jgi:hypothetical protein